MKPGRKNLFRNFLIELIVYTFLVVGYFFVVLQALGDWLARLGTGNPTLYAFVALGLIVAQGVLLERVTILIVELLGLERLE
jgi:hypothetical protein